jgi:hypothetical protein
MRTSLSALVLLTLASCAAAPSAPAVVAARVPSPRDLPASRPAPAVLEEEAAPRQVSLGAELRAYPAGLIPGVYGEVALSEHGALTLGLAANVTDRDDFGEHDDEQGDGFGGGVGYRHYFGERHDLWFVGGRVDLWSLSIDWKDMPGTPAQVSGTSDVLVLMPTAEVGYALALGARWRLMVFVAGGAEINVSTDGEDVGEGAIGLLGLSLVYG